MGSGIAAHLANAGIPVLLLDIVPPNLTEAEKTQKSARDRFASRGLEGALKAKPAAFFHKSRAALVQTGNLEDDLPRLAECDLIIEAIVEKLEIKRALFERLEPVVKPDCVVASNTSGLRIVDLVAGRSARFAANFLVMHFFNPVRYMKLLELVAGPATSAEQLRRVKVFGEQRLGKGIVLAKDTPNFVGNRIGTHAMLTGIHLMLAEGLAPEDLDAITGLPMGHPKSASFRTADMVGLDTLKHVADNCYAALGADPERETFKLPGFVSTMVERQLLGNKTRAGFYKKQGSDILTFDPVALDYRAKAGNAEIKSACKRLSGIEDPRARVRALFEDDGPAGRFAWKLTARVLVYAASLVGEICDSITAIDDAMRWGYNWELGPFETWDAIGFQAVVERLARDGVALPESVQRMQAAGARGFYSEGRVFELAQGRYVEAPAEGRGVTLQALRRGHQPLLVNGGAEVWELGDGVLGLTFTSKANSIDQDVIAMLHQATELAERQYLGMVIANQGEHFSVGANLFGVVVAAQSGQWEQLGQMVHELQQAGQRMRYAQVPIVAAPYGVTVGGGLEVCLGAGHVQAAAETYAGLVEVGVGLVPAGGGCLRLLWRALEGIPEGTEAIVDAHVAQVFKNIALARVATSAEEAKFLGYFHHSDGVSFDRSRQLTDAKARVLGLAQSGYHPPAPRAFKLTGESGIATLSMMVDTLVAGGYATPYDAVVARRLAKVLCGGASGASRPVTEQEVLDLEREAFLSLCGEAKSQERMQHMLMTNKPLRN